MPSYSRPRQQLHHIANLPHPSHHNQVLNIPALKRSRAFWCMQPIFQTHSTELLPQILSVDLPCCGPILNPEILSPGTSIQSEGSMFVCTSGAYI
jgi:hypothetical protein